MEGRCWRRWNRVKEGYYFELKGLRDGEEGEGVKKENNWEDDFWLFGYIRGILFCMGR